MYTIDGDYNRDSRLGARPGGAGLEPGTDFLKSQRHYDYGFLTSLVPLNYLDLAFGYAQSGGQQRHHRGVGFPGLRGGRHPDSQSIAFQAPNLVPGGLGLDPDR